MGFGVAIMQPALPALVREWMPQRIALGAATSTNGLVMGGMLAPSLTALLVLPLTGNSWRLDLVVWAAPVLATALVFVLLAPRRHRSAAVRGAGGAALVAGLERPAGVAARPDLRHEQCDVLRRQRLSAGLSRQSRARRPDRPALACLNGAQLVAHRC